MQSQRIRHRPAVQPVAPPPLTLPRDLAALRLQIEYRSPAALMRRNRIARKHPQDQIERIARSIGTFGFVMPVLVDRAGFLVTGHARTEAAILAGLTEIPTICVDHLTEAEARAFALADNRLADLSSWDDDIVRLEIEDLSSLDISGDLGFDLGVIGFNTAEIDVILSGEQGNGAVEEAVELPATDTLAVSRVGDLWQLGRHRILCGNALDPEIYALLLGDEVVVLVCVDPPYGVPISGHVSGTGRHREFVMGSGEMSKAEFSDFLGSAITAMAANVTDGGILMMFMDWRHVSQLIVAGEATGLRLINLCVWNKTNAGMGSLYRSKHELVCIFKKGTAPHINNVELGKYGRYRTNVWDFAGVNTFRKGRDADLADHPTVKPTPLIMEAIRDVTRHGDIVLDPFGGSGSTLLAAEKTGRRARLIELDPLYVDVAIRRWQALTGQQAVHAITGETWDERGARQVDDAAPDDDEPDDDAPATTGRGHHDQA